MVVIKRLKDNATNDKVVAKRKNLKVVGKE